MLNFLGKHKLRLRNKTIAKAMMAIPAIAAATATPAIRPFLFGSEELFEAVVGAEDEDVEVISLLAKLPVGALVGRLSCESDIDGVFVA